MPRDKSRLRAQVFQSTSKSWEAMCEDVAEFADGIGPERLVNVSMAAAGGQDLFGAGASGVIVVWYWD